MAIFKITGAASLFSGLNAILLATFKSNDTKSGSSLAPVSILAWGPARFFIYNSRTTKQLLIFINQGDSSKSDKNQNASDILLCWAAT